jgi:hypothetical protein
MDFRRILPEIRCQSCLSPGSEPTPRGGFSPRSAPWFASGPLRSLLEFNSLSDGGLMRNTLLALLVFACAPSLLAQGAPPQLAPDQPYSMEYYYKVQWGHQQEFLQLFLKNHYPLLQKNVESGRMLSVKIEQPANHTTEDGRWDYRVTIRFKNSTVATTANPDEERLIKQLWPDQAKYIREEQRRFEILLGHWDLPVTDITPPKK